MSTPTIMVVDDEPQIRRVMRTTLSSNGYTVLEARSGEEALELMRKERPELVLLDVNMPEMDGIEFVRHLVKRPYTGGLILISGEEERTLHAVEKLAQAHQFNVLGHLHKPASQEKLAQLLDEWTMPMREEPGIERKIYGPDEVFLAIKGGELVNYYQPKVEISTRRVVGVETLVRWNHPRDGMVFPDRFIGLAETNGMIDDLTLVVLIGALLQAKAWLEEGLKLHVAVNLSMDNLVTPYFTDLVFRLATKAGVPPQAVGFEVTESRLMEDLRAPLDILTRLRLKRFRISIDDFGTGHSSLVQLRDIPFDELKIDKCFVHGAWDNEKLRAIFDSSLELGKQLGMSVVAEGVEDKADWDFLRKTGCDIAQGYFIAKPMPAADLPGWIRSWEKSAEQVDQ